MAKNFDYVKRIQEFIEWREKYGKDFNPKKSYPRTKTSKVIKPNGHGTVVGKAFLLTEAMVERKAPKKEMERAVRYLMVCIDADKYHLNYHKAYEDFGIFELNCKY